VVEPQILVWDPHRVLDGWRRVAGVEWLAGYVYRSAGCFIILNFPQESCFFAGPNSRHRSCFKMQGFAGVFDEVFSTRLM
jgi:hypothetical protein